jgi:hypothetical protein
MACKVEPLCALLVENNKLCQSINVINEVLPCEYGGPGSSVGIATDYGLDGPGIESR